MSKKQLTKLDQKRDAVRLLTTNLFAKIESELIDETASISVLEEDLNVLTEKAERLKSLDSEIEDLIEVNSIAEEIASSDEYQEKCIRFANKIKRCIKNRDSDVSVNSQQNLVVNQSNTSHERTSNSHSVKLPKLVIKQFSGDPRYWNEFWNSFNSTIHQNDSLSKVEKFAYLKTFLTDQALNVVSGFELSNANYDSCIKLLTDRFGRKDVIINTFMNKILNLGSVKYSSNVGALRKLHDELEISIRNLESLQVTSGSYGHLLIPVLLKLMPEDLVLEFNRKYKENVDVSNLIAFLKNEIECREASSLVLHDRKPANQPQRNFQPKHEKTFVKGVPTTAAFNAQISTSVCIFCSAPHDSFKCKLPPLSKIEKLKLEKRCFKCFKMYHMSKNCRSKFQCFKCKRNNHHTTVCLVENNHTSNSMRRNEANVVEGNSDQQLIQNCNFGIGQTSNNTRNSEIISSVSQCKATDQCLKNVYLQTCTVVASSNSKSRTTRILLDNGSQRSFITEKLVQNLNLKPLRYENLSVYSFGMQQANVESYPVVEVRLKQREGREQDETIVEALVVPHISGAMVCAPDRRVREIMAVNGLEVADSYDGSGLLQIEVLIGSDRFWDFVLSERYVIDENLSAVNTIFGWVITGKNFKDIATCSQNILIMKNAVIMNDLRIFWELDSMGIESENSDMSANDQSVVNKFENELSFKDNRYIAKLIWNSNPDELDNNFEVAEKRFIALRRKLTNDKEICEEYANIIKEQLKNGIVEICGSEVRSSGYYMPHRAVVRPDKKTSRVRIVFDASSKKESAKSLNDFLEPGPNLNPNILDVILKFRKHEIAFTGDIEKAFLMIGIAEEDRKYLKFIWFGNNDQEHHTILNMARLPFGIRTSPFILAATIKYHIGKYKIDKPECYEMLNTTLYVDDLVYGANNVENAYGLSSDAVTVLGDASMKLRKFNSNSKDLKRVWLCNDMLVDNDSPDDTKVLGLEWRPNEDVLRLDIRALLEFSASHQECSKRYMLQVAAKIYDPVGYVSPFVIRIKILLQQVWLRGLDWDDQLPNDIEIQFKKWLSELIHLRDLSVTRKYFEDGDDTDVTIHIFCDASVKGYGALAYFRYKTKSNEFKTSFILSKSKVAPLKKLTLPRLELMGAVIAVRLSKYLLKLFNDVCNKVYFWGDSQIVLHWIKGDSRNWKPFVCNRVSEIQDISNPEDWRHCSGDENPADLLTRGLTVESLKNSDLWWHGPPWLQFPSSTWPVQPLPNMKNDEQEECRRKTTVMDCIVNDEALDLARFSSLLKLLRVTAWIKRFLAKARKLPTESGPLSATEIHEAEEFWIRKVQKQFFPSEITALQAGKCISKDSNIYSLAPFIDENQILRIRGRLEEAECSLDEKHPMLLPKGSLFTELMVSHTHNRMFHMGISATLSKLREKFWILKGRQIVKKIINRCLICRKHTSKPANQMTAQIPKDRLSETPPFSVIGVDFTGPVYVKSGKEVQKSYITLFTCAVTRAVHLELVSDLSTKKFLLAFRRFLSRRGNCRIVYSDNAKTFKSACKDIRYFFDIIKSQEFKDFFSSEGILWKFIVQLAPWWGGFYERLMKSIKEPLKKILGRAQLTFEEFITVLTEVENILNQRPLTFVYNDASEPSPLSPAHFLHVGHSIKYPFNFAGILSSCSTKDALIKRKQYQSRLLGHIWTKWKKLYLLDLRNFHNFGTPDAKADLQVNDVVLVEGTSKSKFLWDLGLITQVRKGRDGLVRSCVVKTRKGEYTRPVQLLYPLEL